MSQTVWDTIQGFAQKYRSKFVIKDTTPVELNGDGHPAAQGDITFRFVNELPEGAKQVAQGQKEVIVAHSETGHHHVMRGEDITQWVHPTEPGVCYLQPSMGVMDLVHLRSYDTHTAWKCDSSKGKFVEIRRQREETPEGWRLVQD